MIINYGSLKYGFKWNNEIQDHFKSEMKKIKEIKTPDKIEFVEMRNYVYPILKGSLVLFDEYENNFIPLPHCRIKLIQYIPDEYKIILTESIINGRSYYEMVKKVNDGRLIRSSFVNN